MKIVEQTFQSAGRLESLPHTVYFQNSTSGELIFCYLRFAPDTGLRADQSWLLPHRLIVGVKFRKMDRLTPVGAERARLSFAVIHQQLEIEVTMPDEHESSPPLNTFIVRFWREPGTNQARWYGQVQHVQSGERAAFADEAALLSFIRRWVEAPGGSQELRKGVKK